MWWKPPLRAKDFIRRQAMRLVLKFPAGRSITRLVVR